MSIDFCLPAYNESQILPDSLRQLLTFLTKQNFPFAWQVVIIVNGSDESFVRLARNQEQLYQPKVKVVVYPEKGKGHAVMTYALQSAADIYVFMDVDLAVDLAALPNLIQPIINNQADMVIGSRLLADSIMQRSWARDFSSRFYVWLSRLILRHRFSDLHCGFKAIKTKLFQQIIPQIKDQQFFFDTEWLYCAQKMNLRVREIPVNWSENRYAKRQSKVKLFSDGWQFFKKLLALRFGAHQITDWLFDFGLIIKGGFAALELIGGGALYFVSQNFIVKQIIRLTQEELGEDPRDFIANYLNRFAQSLSLGSRHFFAFYLFSHGVIKLFLIIFLLRKKLWAYPASLVVFGLFIIYQLYRLTIAFSIGLLALTIFDVLVLWLIWREYRLLKH